MDVLNVVKVGGNVIDDPEALQVFLKEFAQLNGHKILVHGGGKIATRIAESMNLKTEMVKGRRITDDQMIDVVIMTYGGLINRDIVCKLQKHKSNALGLTGADGNLIGAVKRPETGGIDYGWVGDPQTVNTDLLTSLIESNIVPVVAPLTHDYAGHLLNTNADTIASIIAVALSNHFEVKLSYCFELHGVLKKVEDPSSLIPELTKEQFSKLKCNETISEGMIPKLDNAFDALDKGVQTVRLMSYRSILNLNKLSKNECTVIG